MSLMPMVFTADEVEKRTDFFIAGRGGITNLHAGNKAFRERALEHAEKYNELRTCERGKRFARNLLFQYFADVTFVVPHSYFFKNLGTISKEKIKSVETEHGGCLDGLKDLPSDRYFTVGETWILGIISDIVRFEAAKQKGKITKPSLKKRPAPPTVSDDECTAQECERTPKKKRFYGERVDSQTEPLSSFFPSRNEIVFESVEKKAKALKTKGENPVSADDLMYQLDEFDALINWMILAMEDDARMFDDDFWDIEELFSILPDFGSWKAEKAHFLSRPSEC